MNRAQNACALPLHPAGFCCALCPCARAPMRRTWPSRGAPRPTRPRRAAPRPPSPRGRSSGLARPRPRLLRRPRRQAGRWAAAGRLPSAPADLPQRMAPWGLGGSRRAATAPPAEARGGGAARGRPRALGTVQGRGEGRRGAGTAWGRRSKGGVALLGGGRKQWSGAPLASRTGALGAQRHGVWGRGDGRTRCWCHPCSGVAAAPSRPPTPHGGACVLPGNLACSLTCSTSSGRGRVRWRRGARCDWAPGGGCAGAAVLPAGAAPAGLRPLPRATRCDPPVMGSMFLLQAPGMARRRRGRGLRLMAGKAA
jgi:hypothetical protein